MLCHSRVIGRRLAEVVERSCCCAVREGGLVETSQAAVFAVSVLDESSHEHVEKVHAQTPEEALKGMQDLQGYRPGIYSVWDPDDPHGMPLLEATL